MTRKAFKGVNLLVQIGTPGLLAPAATYAAGNDADGLKKITAITNEPANMVFVPTARTSEIHKQKASERIKFLGGTETGDVFEIDESIMGNINAVLCRSNTAEAYYDPAIDRLLLAASESNKQMYVKMERYLGFDATVLPAPGAHVYHIKAAICTIKSDNSPVNADAKVVEQAFTLEGSGEWIEGYITKA